LFFNIIALFSNTRVTSVKKLFDASQRMKSNGVLSRYHSALCGLCDLIVIIEQLSSDDEIGRSHWLPGIVSRVDVITWQLFQSSVPYYSMRNKNNVQRWWRDQAGLWVILENMQQEFYLTGIKEPFDKCNTCIAIKGDYVE